MKKRTPDAKAWLGLSLGGVVAVITGLLAHFGFKVSGNELTILTAALGLAGHFLGTYLAPYEARASEIVAYVEKLWAELHGGTISSTTVTKTTEVS